MSDSDVPVGAPGTGLRRSLGLGMLTLYGVGIIVGAGIYVLIGEVVGAAGFSAPLSFLIAGILVAPTGYSYAELVARFPEAAGQAAYVRHAFNSITLSRIVGFAVAAVGILAAASIARGAAAYLGDLAPIPVPLGAAGLVILFTGIACLGVRQSVGIAAVMTFAELLGLAYVIIAGGHQVWQTGTVVPLSELADLTAAPAGIAAGAFIAFFAFLGFENMANMAEEAEDAYRALPLAIFLALAISTLLYIAVATVAVISVPLETLVSSPTPLRDVVASSPIGNAEIFGSVALIATANGVLIEILMVARVSYGMAHRGWLPAWFAAVWPRSRTPVRTTLIAGAIVLLLAVPFDVGELAAMTSNVLLSLFVIVNLALMRLQHVAPRDDLPIRAPRWLPPLGAAGAAALLAAQFLMG